MLSNSILAKLLFVILSKRNTLKIGVDILLMA